jgi:hypothetical protein
MKRKKPSRELRGGPAPDRLHGCPVPVNFDYEDREVNEEMEISNDHHPRYIAD